eukprot:2877094-Prymnesium_polylepis.1
MRASRAGRLAEGQRCAIRASLDCHATFLFQRQDIRVAPKALAGSAHRQQVFSALFVDERT